MSILRPARGSCLAITLLFSVAVTGRTAFAASEKVVFSFDAEPAEHYPVGGLYIDAKGNIFGAGKYGADINFRKSGQYGFIYELTAGGKLKNLHQFIGIEDGGGPVGTLIADANGNLYGASSRGRDGHAHNPTGGGSVFEIVPPNKFVTLAGFCCAYQPEGPGPVVFDASGDLIGQSAGGTGGLNSGMVFKVTPGVDGASMVFDLGNLDPGQQINGSGGLYQDPAGNLFGIANVLEQSESFLFEVTEAGVEKTLYTFADGAQGPVIADSAGNFYGTSFAGGTSNVGYVFKVTTGGVMTVLHNFAGGADGRHPLGGLAMDAKGNLFGTTVEGGTANSGTVFQIDNSGEETVLHTFSGGSDGEYPSGPLTFGKGGNLYGVTSQGGPSDGGTIFEVIP